VVAMIEEVDKEASKRIIKRNSTKKAAANSKIRPERNSKGIDNNALNKIMKRRRKNLNNFSNKS
jgi:hypothetical protein